MSIPPEPGDLREALLVRSTSSMNSTSLTDESVAVVSKRRRLDDYDETSPGDNTIVDAGIEEGAGIDRDSTARTLRIPARLTLVEPKASDDKTTHWLDESISVRPLEINSNLNDVTLGSIDPLDAASKFFCSSLAVTRQINNTVMA